MSVPIAMLFAFRDYNSSDNRGDNILQENKEHHWREAVNITQYCLEADLCIPKNARALVVFSHGSGSSRYSTRNEYIAQILNDAGFGTLLVDLLRTEEKAADSNNKHLRFDIALLTSRMESVTKWLLEESRTQKLALGYFGSSTGAGAALLASIRFRNTVKAVVSRGGRPDLAESELHNISAPTLLIVGELDSPTVGINKRVLKKLKHAAATDLVIIPRAGHLFEEHGKMEQVADLTVSWFRHYLLEESIQDFSTRRNRGIMRNFLSSLKTRASLQLQFKDREAAGEMLAARLRGQERDSPIIVGIANGGIVVADIVRQQLRADLEIVFPRRLRSPTNSENAIGAIMQDGSTYFDKSSMTEAQVSDEYLKTEKQVQTEEIDRRLAFHGLKRRQYSLNGRTVILVDDGAATGSTIAVVARWIREQRPSKLIVALPVASPQATQVSKKEADRTEIIFRPSDFRTVEQYYRNFGEITDQAAVRIVQESDRVRSSGFN